MRTPRASSSNPVDDITHKLGVMALGDDRSAYLDTFRRIADVAVDVRRVPMLPGEQYVTEQLASPFTEGGWLILLERPRRCHPWHEGGDRVIDTCPTLYALRETLELMGTPLETVSVIDARPYISKELEPVDESQLAELDELTRQAIIAKNPDFVLYMGTVAKHLYSKMDVKAFISSFSKHPNYYITYNPCDDPEELFRRFIEAAKILKSRGAPSKIRVPSLKELRSLKSFERRRRPTLYIGLEDTD